jgi:hypothetical protein
MTAFNSTPIADRNDLAGKLSLYGFKVGAEIGTASGEYLKVLCDSNPNMLFYAVDVWKPYEGYIDFVHQETFDKMYRDFKKQMRNVLNYKVVKKFSMDAVKQFEDGYLDFVYIDANHQEPFITQDIEAWSEKVKSGGIVSGHDYNRVKQVDVKKAVDKYVFTRGIKEFFILEDSGRRTRSWMFIKP